jgi:hypothetical protein
MAGANEQKGQNINWPEFPWNLEKFQSVLKQEVGNSDIRTAMLKRYTDNNGTEETLDTLLLERSEQGKCFMPRIYVTDESKWTTCGIKTRDDTSSVCVFHHEMLKKAIVKNLYDILTIKWKEREYEEKEENWAQLEESHLNALLQNGYSNHTDLVEKVLKYSSQLTDTQQKEYEKKQKELMEQTTKLTHMIESTAKRVAAMNGDTNDGIKSVIDVRNADNYL